VSNSDIQANNNVSQSLKLNVSERGKFRKLECIVAEGISSFRAAGEALKEIRDLKLYRESYKTFEKYVDEKWGFKKSRAYQIIEASDVSKRISTNGGQNERASEITSERQLRELKEVPDELMAPVIDRAAELAGDDKITASDLKQSREEILVFEDVDDSPEPEPKKKKQGVPKDSEERGLSITWQLANAAIEKLELIDVSDAERGSAFFKVSMWINSQLNDRGTV
jgi:hypothetical protein